MIRPITIAIAAALCSAGCSHLDPRAPSPVPLASQVDLERFSGDWYVIAHITTGEDETAHNAVENYALRPDGNIDTTYTYRAGSFEGEYKKLTPVGFPVEDGGHALWGMRFDVPYIGLPWPFLFEYRISYLEPDYSAVVIGRSKRDLVWLMARTPEISTADYARYKTMIGEWGYDLNKLRKVPQQWPEAE